MFGYNSTADDFKPHSFDKRLRHYRPLKPKMAQIPQIVISREAFAKMWLYVDIAQEEVGWMGTAIRRPDGDFYIPQVWLLKQEVTGVETVLSNEGLSDMAMELLERGDEGLKDWDNLRFWGHSHVRMFTRPSGTDERTMVMLEEAEHPWFIRGILNKNGRIEFSIFLYEENIVIEDAPWSLEAEAAQATAPAAAASQSKGEKAAPAAKQPWYATVLGLGDPLLKAGATSSLREEVESEFKAKVKSRSWIQRAPTPASTDGAPGADAKSASDAAPNVDGITLVTAAAVKPDLVAEPDLAANPVPDLPTVDEPIGKTKPGKRVHQTSETHGSE